MNRFVLAALGCFFTTVASAQSEQDRAFDEIGKSLQEIQRSLTASSQQTANSADLTTFDKNVRVYQEPNMATSPSAILTPGTGISMIGQEQNGFFSVTPSTGPLQGRTVYVPRAEIQNIRVSDFVTGSAIDQAMGSIKTMAAKIENNPYIRLKGFKINLSISPSIDFDFEMRNDTAAASTSNR